MKMNQITEYELPKKESSLQIKALKGLVVFLVIMAMLTILSRAADSITIARVEVTTSNGGTISHNIEADGTIKALKDVAVSTTAGIRVDSVEVTEGKVVGQNDILLKLDMDDLKKKKLEAEDELALLKAQDYDRRANEAIAAAEEQKAKDRLYEEYAKTVSDANEMMAAAKRAMEDAYADWQDYKENGTAPSSDPMVKKQLEATLKEKQQAYEDAISYMDGVEKDIEAEVQKAIEEAEAQNLDEEGNLVPLTQEEKQKIRKEVNALEKNKRLVKDAQEKIDFAAQETRTAEDALNQYKEEQAEAKKYSRKEVLASLKAAYIEKKEAYETAKAEGEDIIEQAKRSLEDSNGPETVDTASALTEGNEMELKQIEVDELTRMYDNGGVVRSPQDGMVTKINISAGDTTPEEPFMRIADQKSGYRFTANLEKNDAKYLKAGDKFTLELSGGSIEGLPIETIEVSPNDNNTYVLTAMIPSKIKKVGTSGTLRMDKASQRYDTLIPLKAIHSDGNDYYVYAISESDTVLGTQMTIEKIEVTILDKNSEEAAVDGYFGWDQQFVTSSSKTLRQGDRVRLAGEENGDEQDD